MNESLLFSYSEKRRDFLRFFLLTVVILVIGFVIKIDLQEGSLPHTSFYQTTACGEEKNEKVVHIKVAEGDTIYSIFAASPSPVTMPFPERLAKFYQLNPHLQQQSLLPGELIALPIVENKKNSCKE